MHSGYLANVSAVVLTAQRFQGQPQQDANYKGSGKVTGCVLLAIPGIWLAVNAMTKAEWSCREHAIKRVKVFSSSSQYDVLFHFPDFHIFRGWTTGAHTTRSRRTGGGFSGTGKCRTQGHQNSHISSFESVHPLRSTSCMQKGMTGGDELFDSSSISN